MMQPAQLNSQFQHTMNFQGTPNQPPPAHIPPPRTPNPGDVPAVITVAQLADLCQRLKFAEERIHTVQPTPNNPAFGPTAYNQQQRTPQQGATHQHTELLIKKLDRCKLTPFSGTDLMNKPVKSFLYEAESKLKGQDIIINHPWNAQIIIRHAQNSLCQDAQVWLRNIAKDDSDFLLADTWAGLREVLTNRFCNHNETQAGYDFFESEISRGQTESVRDFNHRVGNARLKCPHMNDAEFMNQYKPGLSRNMLAMFNAEISRNPNFPLQDLMALLERVDEGNRGFSIRHRVPVPTQFAHNPEPDHATPMELSMMEYHSNRQSTNYGYEAYRGERTTTLRDTAQATTLSRDTAQVTTLSRDTAQAPTLHKATTRNTSGTTTPHQLTRCTLLITTPCSPSRLPATSSHTRTSSRLISATTHQSSRASMTPRPSKRSNSSSRQLADAQCAGTQSQGPVSQRVTTRNARSDTEPTTGWEKEHGHPNASKCCPRNSPACATNTCRSGGHG